MKTKKKVLVIALAAALIAIAVIGGSLAWFTDSAEAENVFVVGKISIDLHDEGAHGADGACGDAFEQNQTILPIVNTDDPQKDANYIPKVVHVENDGDNSAYVRVYVGVPYAIADILHLDLNTTDWIEEGSAYSAIDGVLYQLRQFRYVTEVGANSTTYDLLTGVYMDAAVDIKDNGGKDQLCIENEDGTYKFYDFDINALRELKIPVFAQAVQVAGFDDAVTALNTAFPNVPGAKTVEVKSDAELTAALKDVQPGSVIKLAEGTYNGIAIPVNAPGFTLQGAGEGTVVKGIRLPEKTDGKVYAIRDMTIDGSSDFNNKTNLGVAFDQQGTNGSNGSSNITVDVANCTIKNAKKGIAIDKAVTNVTLKASNVKFDTISEYAISIKTANNDKDHTTTGNTFTATGCEMTNSGSAKTVQTFYPEAILRFNGEPVT